MIKLSKPDSLLVKEMYVHDHEANQGGKFDTEMSTICFLMKHLKSDSNFMDIGAYEGYFSLIASHKIKTGMIYTFEPCVSSYEIVKKNVELHNLINVKVFNMSVCDKVGRANIYWRPQAQCISRIFNIPSDNNTYYPDNVPTISLDSLVVDDDANNIIGNRSIDCMKIDIEGAEVELFNGATKFFKKNNHCKVMLELHCNNIRERGDVNIDVFLKTIGNMFDFYDYEADKRITMDIEVIRKCLNLSNGVLHYALIPK